MNHAEVVLASVLSKTNPRRDLLATTAVRLQKEHFTNEIHRNIFLLLLRYYDRTNEVMPLATFTKALEDNGTDAAKALAYTQTFSSLEDSPAGPADFEWAVQELCEQQAKRLTGVAITEAMEILERGYEVGREFYKGHQDARKYITAKVNEIERLADSEGVPEGDIFSATSDIMADYEKRRDGELGKGIASSIRVIDDQTGGGYLGELILVCGFANMGKSMISTQWAWSAAVEQGLNVFFATSETVRDQVIRRILARHSRLPQFERPGGINSADIKRGLLTKDDEKVLANVLEDWHYNSTYGKLNVVQTPKGATIGYVEARLREYAREVEISLCVDDYFELHKAETRRSSEREEFNEILRDGKLMAVHNNVLVVSPWQINREGQAGAMQNGHFTIGKALADTSEADKSPDQNIALLRDPDSNREARIQFLKMRDDALPPISDVTIDYRSTYIGNVAAPTAFVPGATSNDDLMSLMQ